MKYCPDIFQNLYIEKRNETQVNLALCCIAKISPNESTVSQQTEWLNNQRNYLLTTGELPNSCSFCAEAEIRNVKSQRLKLLEDHPQFVKFNDTKINLKKIQYNCDNICNLKCIVCSSKFSNSWIEDEKKLTNIGYELTIDSSADLNNKLKPTKHNKLVYDLDLENLETIYLNGGEPLMSNDMINFLSYVALNSNPKEIEIQFNTNSTWPLKSKLMAILEKFKHVTIMCSIDGIGERFEYIRFPGNWKTVEKNLIDFKKTGFECILTPAIGVHNILYTDEIINWAQENNYKMQRPLIVFGRLSLTNCPLNLKNVVLEYINKLPNFNGKDIFINEALSIANPDLRWIEYLNNLDKIRGNSWKISLSKLYSLIYN